ncbi:hypothetical protein GF367_02705, partial [Candidatus Woesearchaeota archaeon]|nr:hypothetical protein [Candidatus Woesearchaeota archaeon]
MAGAPQMEVITSEPCPFCHHKTLTLRQAEREVPYFGNVVLFSMDCDHCKYHKSDLELEQSAGRPIKHAFSLASEEDLRVRVVKSSTATIRVPRIGSIEPGETANGYIT